MSLVKWAFIGLLLLPVLEVAVFLAVAALVGWLVAGILFLATSVLGVAVLRRFGRRDLARLAEALASDGIRALHLETPGLAKMVAAILLVFPGFITDVLGAALFIPQFRRWSAGVLRKSARRSRARRENILDLEPGEWRQIESRGRRHNSKGEA